MLRGSKIPCFSNDLWAGGSKTRLAKAAGAEPCERRNEKLHDAVAQRHLIK